MGPALALPVNPLARLIPRAVQVLRRRRIRRLFVAAGLSLVAGACGLVMFGAALSRATPSWWRSFPREDPALASLARRVENSVQTEVFQNRASHREDGLLRSDPWSIRLSAEEASAWLAVRLPMWMANQKEKFRWPRELEEVQVDFAEGTLTFGARLDAARGARVLTATVWPHLDEQGRLFLPAKRVNVGRLAVPASWVLEHARGAAARCIPANLRDLPETEALVRAFEGDHALIETAVFKLGDGRRVRVLSFSLDGGMLQITCQTERPG